MDFATSANFATSFTCVGNTGVAEEGKVDVDRPTVAEDRQRGDKVGEILLLKGGRGESTPQLGATQRRHSVNARLVVLHKRSACGQSLVKVGPNAET